MKLLLKGSVAVVAMLHCSPIGAQATQETSASGQASAAGEAQLADIVVTAERRSERLQRSPVAVSVISSDALASRGVVDAQDLTKLVPALKINNVSGGGVQVTIRGVGSFAGNAYTEPGVAINFNGVYIPRPQGANGLLFDVERVEVLKGPQGTLYGRNATAGAVNIIPKAPTSNLEGEVTAEVGNYHLFRGSAAINLPLGDGIALRLAGQGVSRDGYLSDGYSDDKGYAGRASLLIGGVADFKMTVVADVSHQGGKGSAAVPVPFGDPHHPFTGPTEGILNPLFQGLNAQLFPGAFSLIGRDGFLDTDVWGVSATAEYKFAGAVLTVLPAYRKTDVSYRHYGGGAPVDDDETSKVKSLEVRLASDNDGPLKWLIGGFLYNERLPFDIRPNFGAIANSRQINQLDTTSKALFGQATYGITDTVRVTGGLRYTREDKSQNGSIISISPPATAATCPAPAIFSPGSGSCTSPTPGDLAFEKLTWKVGIDADLSPTSLVYANVSTGFKAGGFFASLAPNTFKPEKLTAYTIGSKNRFFDNRLQFNVEGYLWRYKDKQVSFLDFVRPVGVNLVTINAASATFYGFDAELVWQASVRDRFRVDAQYTHSRYGRFSFVSLGTPVDRSGRQVPFAPEFTLDAGYDHRFELAGGAALTFSASTRLETASWTGEEYAPGERQKAFTISTANLTYSSADGRLSISAWVDNIENKAVIGGTFFQPFIRVPLATLRPPRTYGVRTSVKF